MNYIVITSNVLIYVNMLIIIILIIIYIYMNMCDYTLLTAGCPVLAPGSSGLVDALLDVLVLSSDVLLKKLCCNA